MRTLSAIDVSPSSVVAEAPVQSLLHSPVPYLFGGLAAMLILIAFALLILACSYWKISGCLGVGSGNQSDQNGEEKPAEDKSLKVYEEKFVVIMAGDELPTFLATPICIKASTFEDLYSNQDTKDESDDADIENPKGEESIATATGTESIDQMVQTENRAIAEETPNQHHYQNH